MPLLLTASLLHSYGHENNAVLTWLALEVPRKIARFYIVEYAIAGIIAAIISGVVFSSSVGKAAGTFLMVCGIGICQSLSYVRPFRLLPPDVCSKCAELPAQVENPSLELAFGVTLFATSLWMFFLAMPLAIIIAGFHLFMVKFHGAFKSSAA